MLKPLNKTNDGTRKVVLSKLPTTENFADVRAGTKKNVVRFLRPSDDARRTEKSVNNQILAALTDYDFARLQPHLESVALAYGEELCASGESDRYVYFPETAVISHLYNLADGNSIEVAMVGSEGASGLCALLGRQPSAHSAQVIIEGHALRIKTEILKREFAAGAKIQPLLLDYVNAHITQISQRTVCESFHVIEKRLCSWLLMLQDRVKKNQLAMTQEQISIFLGVNRPSVTVVAKALRDKGLINYMRGKVQILDRRGLEFSACECYSTVQKSLLNSAL